MKPKTILSLLTVAMALGTAWAVRGKFGHEQGAAWAGAIGGIAVLLVAKRDDWYNKVLKVALASAFGWGMGGMISYGVVVGYGRASDFINAYYGLSMLFVIGALYGFCGGGFLGLALIDSKEVKVRWHALLTEMIALGLLVYAFLINQLEWFMTPPRSEMWAACFGASIALAWFIVRLNQPSVMRVAVWSAMGAGFGFAFGNFLQVLGAGSSLPFNFWNIMEYSIGFFGGLGMAYGVLTSTWPKVTDSPSRHSNLLPLAFLFVLIPFLIWDQSFVAKKLDFVFNLGGTESTITTMQVMAALSIAVVAVLAFLQYYRTLYSYTMVRNIFITYLVLYTFLSFLLTGIYTHPIEQYLYLVNIIVILVLLPSLQNTFDVKQEYTSRWLLAAVVSLLIIALLAVVAVHSHEELKGSHVRFEL